MWLKIYHVDQLGGEHLQIHLNERGLTTMSEVWEYWYDRLREDGTGKLSGYFEKNWKAYLSRIDVGGEENQDWYYDP